MSQRDIYQALEVGLGQAQSAQTPGEVHGTLTGMLCIDNDIAPAQAVDDVACGMLDNALDALREMTLQGLFDPELSFTPLLPDDEAVDLGARVQALARWCAGFVYGLSHSGEFDLAQRSADVREVIADITELSRAALSVEDNDDEAAEGDYAELVEYVRVGVQMVFMELQPAREGPSEREPLH